MTSRSNPLEAQMSDFNVNGTDYSLDHVERFDYSDLFHFAGGRSDLSPDVWFGIQVTTDLDGKAIEVNRYAWTPDAGLNVWNVTVSPCSPDLILAVSWAEEYASQKVDLPDWVAVSDFSMDRTAAFGGGR